MKLGKACDIYQLTVEHLRYSGDEAKLAILKLINRIIKSIYYLTCVQIKLGLGTAVYKGKNKPIQKSSSYRRITVTPIIGAILDYYVDPITEGLFRKVQSPDQLGFTSKLNYLMAAVQRGECQRWAIDRKMTCFGISLDGEAAFPNVDRDIQVRELYSVGERGDYLKYSRNIYTNTECHLKQEGQLSRRIEEFKGNRQGHVKASGHYKAYLNPCLSSLNESELGFWIGPICVTAVSVADDTYLLSSSPSALQAILDLTNFFAKRYRIIFNAGKTKLVVTGSKVDMTFYQETSPWIMDGQRIAVTENNEHLGLVVSGTDEEQKNVDANIQECRKSLFGLLGPAFAFKCLLAPTVQSHLWRTFTLPVLQSGLNSLPIRPPIMRSLVVFHNKVLRGMLKLSKRSPVPALYFLLGELPIEARIHLDTLSLFYNIWTNRDTTIYRIVQYLLKMADGNSLTWSAHLRILCMKYDLPDPLLLMNEEEPWTKTKWSTLTKTKVTVYYEKMLRKEAQSNSRLKFLNVQIQGLSGSPHPALLNISTTQEALKVRHHLKFLSGDYLTAERLAEEHGTNPQCKLCLAPRESPEHVLTACRATADITQRLLPDLLNAVLSVHPTCGILQNHSEHLTQFILDCTSLNLPAGYRIGAHNPKVSQVFRISRHWCYAISRARARLLEQFLQ